MTSETRPQCISASSSVGLGGRTRAGAAAVASGAFAASSVSASRSRQICETGQKGHIGQRSVVAKNGHNFETGQKGPVLSF